MKYLLTFLFIFSTQSFAEESLNKYTINANGNVEIIEEHKYSNTHSFKNYLLRVKKSFLKSLYSLTLRFILLNFHCRKQNKNSLKFNFKSLKNLKFLLNLICFALIINRLGTKLFFGGVYDVCYDGMKSY